MDPSVQRLAALCAVRELIKAVHFRLPQTDAPASPGQAFSSRTAINQLLSDQFPAVVDLVAKVDVADVLTAEATTKALVEWNSVQLDFDNLLSTLTSRLGLGVGTSNEVALLRAIQLEAYRVLSKLVVRLPTVQEATEVIDDKM